uniref:Fibrillar collagen NC1 domain-containing protein n=1 Tax=Hippocampus comes TaxID=109280 RepID=A0A3Q2Y462_HIPCM
MLTSSSPETKFRAEHAGVHSSMKFNLNWHRLYANSKHMDNYVDILQKLGLNGGDKPSRSVPAGVIPFKSGIILNQLAHIEGPLRSIWPTSVWTDAALVLSVRSHRVNSAFLFTLLSEKKKLLLGLQLVPGSLVLHTGPNSSVALPYEPHDGQWHQLAVGIKGQKVTLYASCGEQSVHVDFGWDNEEGLAPEHEDSFLLGRSSQQAWAHFEGAICQFDLIPSAQAAHNYCKYIKKQCREADTYRPNLAPLLPVLPRQINASSTAAPKHGSLITKKATGRSLARSVAAAASAVRYVAPGFPGDFGERGPPGADGEPVGHTECKPHYFTFTSSIVGDKGPDGTPGPIGPEGFPGDMGPPGENGLEGPKGKLGTRGLPGPRGLPGFEVIRVTKPHPTFRLTSFFYRHIPPCLSHQNISALSLHAMARSLGHCGPFQDATRGASHQLARKLTGLGLVIITEYRSLQLCRIIADASICFAQGHPGTPGEVGPSGPLGRPVSCHLFANCVFKQLCLKMYLYVVAEQGEPGLEGEAGPAGPDGTKGEKGDMGQEGDNGEKGETGLKGKEGLPGSPGIPGVRGQEGKCGKIGEKGKLGPKGAKGHQGHLGETGTVGKMGPQGSVGPKGSRGTIGHVGAPGRMGQQGETGLSGYEGHQGSSGPMGRPGPKGEKGEQGDDGKTEGPLGPPGDIGPPGDRGERGEPGDPGYKGQVGVDGERGRAGAPGLPVSTNVSSFKGSKRQKGSNGCKRNQRNRGRSDSHGIFQRIGGPIGPRGVVGREGHEGVPGMDGKPGIDGTKGMPGEHGNDGETGLPGKAGSRGKTGVTGLPGDQGAFGPKGERGLRGQSGPPGKRGFWGGMGLPGTRGDRGPKGQPGDVGESGFPGILGVLGPKGPPGDFGPKGIRGPKGPQGDMGRGGVMGPIGIIGPSGSAGPRGEKGSRGAMVIIMFMKLSCSHVNKLVMDLPMLDQGAEIFKTLHYLTNLIQSLKNPLGTRENPARICRDLLSCEQKLNDGIYWIDPNLGCMSDTIEVSCNFTGGGQTCLKPITVSKPAVNVGRVQMNFLHLLSTEAVQHVTIHCLNVSVWRAAQHLPASRESSVRFKAWTGEIFEAGGQLEPDVVEDSCWMKDGRWHQARFVFRSMDPSLLPVIDVVHLPETSRGSHYHLEIGPVCFV